METPTINKSQKKSTLSAKKGKNKETIKNILASPYNNSYWPLISPEDHEALRVVLENNLPRIRPEKVNVPWKLLKDIPKADRRAFRNRYAKIDELLIDKKERIGLTFGINDVSKLLENNLVNAVLVSNNVQPRLMVQHIIDESVLYNVPIIVFDNLKQLLLKVCGITSAVICLNKEVGANSKLNFIKDSIVHIYEKYPVPSNHINYERSLNNTKNTEPPQKQQTDLDEKMMMVECNTNDEFKASFYLKRKSKNKRVFVPESSEENIAIHKMEVDSTGFLPFSSTSRDTIDDKIETGNLPIANTSTNVIVSKSEPVYKALIVKRLKGDPNRNRRKIESMKRKRK